MDLNDILTLGVAILALIVSGVSIWLQFRRHSNFVVRLVQYHSLPENDFVELSYFLGNTGNIEYFLVTARPMLIDKNRPSEVVVTDLQELPMTIEINRVNLVTIRFKKEDYAKAKFFDSLVIAFDLLSPDGVALCYFHEIKGLLESTIRPNSFLTSVRLEKLNVRSRPNFVERA